jgi:DNA-binding NtrC family response regulator
MSPEALRKIITYAFPGNIRELRNVLERAHILGPGDEISADELPVDATSHNELPNQKVELREWVRTLPLSLDLRDTLTEIEKSLIERALQRANGVQAEAARMLGLSRSDMGYKVAKYVTER